MTGDDLCGDVLLLVTFCEVSFWEVTFCKVTFCRVSHFHPERYPEYGGVFAEMFTLHQ